MLKIEFLTKNDNDSFQSQMKQLFLQYFVIQIETEIQGRIKEQT